MSVVTAPPGEVKLAQALRPQDVGALVSFVAEDKTETPEGIQVGVAGRGAGTLLGYFIMAEGGYVSLAIEGYSHHITVSVTDKVTVYG